MCSAWLCDPFAAIDQAAQARGSAVDVHAERVFDREARAQVVGDRADAADARRDVRRVGEVPSAQERLEKSRRLEDAERESGRPVRP